MNDLTASTRAELIRMRRWPAVWAVSGVWFLLVILFVFVFNYISYRSGSTNFSNDGASRADLLNEMLLQNLPTSMLGGMPLFGGALMMVLGALVAGSGYQWGTWKTTLLNGPTRGSVMGGTVVAVALWIVALVSATVVLHAALSLLVGAVEGQALTLPGMADVARSFAIGLLIMLTWALIGLFLGTLLRGPSLALGLGLVWALVIEQLLRGIGSSLSAVSSVTDLLPGTAAGSLAGSVMDPAELGTTPGLLDTLSGGRATLTLAAYAVAGTAAVVMMMRRRDVV